MLEGLGLPGSVSKEKKDSFYVASCTKVDVYPAEKSIKCLLEETLMLRPTPNLTALSW